MKQPRSTGASRATSTTILQTVSSQWADVQDVDVILVPERDDFVNPVGVVKGIGELDNVGYRCGRCQRSLPRDRHSRPTTSDPA
jgi:hypothetical protein